MPWNVRFWLRKGVNHEFSGNFVPFVAKKHRDRWMRFAVRLRLSTLHLQLATEKESHDQGLDVESKRKRSG